MQPAIRPVRVALILPVPQRESLCRGKVLIGQPSLSDRYLRSDRKQIEQFLDVLFPHPHTAKRFIAADTVRLIRAMNRVIRIGQLHAPAAEFPIRPAVRIHYLIRYTIRPLRRLIASKSNQIAS
ncbi:hypothetical protein D3C77_370310 [compost metagenome]